METQNNCPNCGQPLETNALQGLCPECLIKAGWPTVDQTESDGDQGGFVPPEIDELGRLFPQLEILELIGRGGMGAVYKARQPNLDRLVALKILARKAGSDLGFTERFTREARALAKLSHPSIVGVYDFGHAGDLSYFIMEYVDGPNLREIEKAGQLSPKEALEIIPQICEALQFAHDAGVVHRDIKPENILLDQKGHVKIADFGLAKIMGQERTNFTLTEPNHVMGTPHYMAPEQVEHPKDVDHRADIYSLGVVFYEMLTGELPLGKFAPPSRKVQMDVRLDEVVLRTLEKEPELRYQQVSQVRTDVQTIASTPQAPSHAEASSHQPKSSLCYISTPDYLRTFRGRFFNIYQGKGELSLDSESLRFQSGWQAVTIPLSSISVLAQGAFPTTAKPLPLHYIAVTFEEHGLSRTLLFTPVRTEVMSPTEANRIGAQWLSDLQVAIRARTGRTLSVERLDVTQPTTRWEYVKVFLFLLVTSTAGFSVIPMMVYRRLPNQLSELLPGIIFAIVMFFMCLTMPRWLGWFRDRSDRRQSCSDDDSKPEAKLNRQGPPALTPEEIDDVFGRLRIPALGVFLAGLIMLCFLVAVFCAKAMEPNSQVMLLPALLLLVIPLVILMGASHMRQASHYRLAVLASFLALLCPVGLPFGIWALILLSQKDVRLAFQRRDGDWGMSSIATTQGGLKIEMADCLRATGFHAILMIGMMGLVVFVAPRFVGTLNALATELPKATLMTIDLFDFMQRFGLILIPTLLCVDFGVGILLRHFLTRSLFRAYSFVCSIMLVLIPLIMFGILDRTARASDYALRHTRQSVSETKTETDGARHDLRFKDIEEVEGLE